MEPDLDTHRPGVLRHCYCVLGSWADAEDLVQDTFEPAWRARDSWQRATHPSRWLYTVAMPQRAGRAQAARAVAEPAGDEGFELKETEASRWITPCHPQREARAEAA